MKRFTARAISMLAFVFLLTAAGYSQQLVLQADVPFEFSVGKKTFPAGEYRVARIAPNTLTLRDGNDVPLATVVTGQVTSYKTTSNPKLRFDFTDGQYALSEVWPADTDTGYQLTIRKRIPVIANNQPATTVGQIFVPAFTGK